MVWQNLDMLPVGIERLSWNFLWCHVHCRTPQEERRHRFCEAPVLQPPSDPFSCNVQWILQFCLQATLATKDTKLEFVSAGTLGLEQAYMLQEKTWKIDKKYLTRDGAHDGVTCDTQTRGTHQSFACDHIIVHLWQLLGADIQSRLQQLKERRSALEEELQYYRELLQRVERRLPGPGSDQSDLDMDLDDEDTAISSPSPSPSPYRPDYDEHVATKKCPITIETLEHGLDKLNAEVAVWSSEAAKFLFIQESLLSSHSLPLCPRLSNARRMIVGVRFRSHGRSRTMIERGISLST